MKQMTRIYFKVAQIISIVLGIIYSVTIIGLILGIPLFIGSGKFGNAYKMSDEELIRNKNSILGWGIFLSLVCAPSIIGLIVLIVIVIMVNNYIGDLEKGDYDKANRSVGQTLKDGTSNAWNGVKDTFAGKSELDKEEEQLQKLKDMLDKGIITQEEYEAKRKQILGL